MKNLYVKKICTAIVSALLITISFPANSAEIEIDTIIRENLFSNNDFRQSAVAECQIYNPGVYGFIGCAVSVQDPNVIWQNFRVGDIYLYDNGVTYSEVKSAPIPTSIDNDYYYVKNCTSLSRAINEEVTVTSQVGHKISTSTTFKRSESQDGDISGVVGIVNFDFGVAINEEITLTNSSTIDNTTIVTTKSTVNEVIPPYSGFILNVEKRVSNAYLDFSGTVTPDAGISYRTYAPFTNYSNYYSAPIQIEGQIWNSTFQSLTKEYVEVPLPTDAVECLAFDIEALLQSQGIQVSQELGAAPEPNSPPVYNGGIYSQTFDMSDGQVLFGIPATAFTDPDGDNLTYTATGMPSWLTFDSGNLVFSSSFIRTGYWLITVTASDGLESASTSFVLEVTRDWGDERFLR